MKLFLNGGGSGKSFIKPFKNLNQEIDINKPVLYVPLAMDENEHPYDGCYEWITEKFKNINIPYIDMTRSFEDLNINIINLLIETNLISSKSEARKLIEQNGISI